MEAFFHYFIISLLGLSFGSFYNVLALRTLKKESFSKPRSYCPKCQHQLSWYENITVFSYLFLRGKCKRCKKGISPLYPIVELLTAVLFIYTYSKFGFTIESLYIVLMLSLMIVIFITDILRLIIPNKILIYFGFPLVFL